MKLLIDTHIFLWLLFSPKKLPQKYLKLLQSSDSELYICSMSFWEISLKYNLGKINFSGLTPADLPQLAKQMKITIIEMQATDMANFYQLPRSEKHKDPFDRAIVWMCIERDMTLVSRDKQLALYENDGLKLLSID